MADARVAAAGAARARLGPALPRDARMRYWAPPADLAPYVSGFNLYAIETPGGQRPRDVFFPGWGNLRFKLTPETRWDLRPRGGEWQAVGAAILVGPTSGLTWSRADSGISVGFGITPAGWRHLVAADAATWADRFTDAEGAVALPIPALADALCAATCDEAIPELFTAALRAAIRPQPAQDARVARVARAFVDPGVASVGEVAQRVGLSSRALQRLAARCFGFGPRQLIRRARFLRSLDALVRHGRGTGAQLIDPSYVDYSHFAKDAQDFLGMRPGSFLALDTPLAKQSLALRKAVLGAPVQALSSGAIAD